MAGEHVPRRMTILDNGSPIGATNPVPISGAVATSGGTKLVDSAGADIDSTNPVPVASSIANPITSIEFEHQKVRAGLMYKAVHQQTVNSGLTAAYSIKAPAAAQNHLVVIINSNNPGKMELYKGATLDAVPGGAAVTANNMNTASINVAGSTVLSAPGFATNGTICDIVAVGGGSSPTSRIGGSGRTGTEWVIAPGEVFRLLWTSGASANCTIDVIAEFYEYTP